MSYASAYDPEQGVAVVGMVGRFPGAPTVRALWKNLVAGVDAISRFREDELEPADAEEMAARREPGYVRARGILDGVELFDAAFFGIPPAEAEVLDPQQRLFLEAAWEALEDAGHDPQSFAGAIGVFAGMSNNSYVAANLRDRPDATARVGALQAMMANEKDYLATRVAYKLNLRGPALNIQTACSTSLVAVCQAVQALLTYQCDMALAGGVSVTLPQRRGYLHGEGAITSPDGRCRAFDAASAGTVFSNGLGVVVLRRLADALADGDRIHAVIKGAALNNDGAAKVSFTAPSVDGQADAIALAQALAGIDPGTIGYVEAHGTGTSLGDPVEVAALTQAFRRGTTDEGFCALASLKTNIGHLDAAAGVAGLIKTVMAVREGVIPASLHFRAPNPKLGLEGSPFYVNAELRPWPAGITPRRAGLSSLGVGGTNAHVVLEEAPAVPAREPVRPEQLLVLSGRSRAALDANTANLRRHLEAHPQDDLADVAFTLQAGRRAFAHRRMLVARDRADALRLLDALDPKRVVTEEWSGTAPAVAFLFPGQGAQHVDMGRGLYETEAVFRSEVDACAEVLRPELGVDIRTLIHPRAEDAEAAARKLGETLFTQTALFTVEYALACLWRSWGTEPAAMLGHSLGEYVAACLAGVFSRDDALRLVARRARLVHELPGGTMLAVRASAEDVGGLLPEGVSVAAINSPSLTVVSGPTPNVEGLEQTLTERGIASRRLATSHAFHSAMLDPVLDRFEAAVRELPRQAPRLRFVSSLTGDWIRPEEAVDPRYWVRQLREPVRFEAGLGRLFGDTDALLLEVGPGQHLSGLARAHPERGGRRVVGSLPPGPGSSDRESLLGAAGRLFLAGVSVDWPAVHAGLGRRLSLPTYAFERKRFWVDPVPAATPERSPALTAASTPLAPSPAPAVAAAPAPPRDRSAEVVARLQTLFAGLSGLEVASLEPSASFLELGLDSLFLTQAGTALQKTFGVKVTFRELLEELSTIEALAARIAESLPPEPPAPPPPAPSAVDMPRAPQAGPTNASDGGPVSSPPPDPSVLERVFNQQLQIMARQLDMLKNGHGTATVDSMRALLGANDPATLAPASPTAATPSAAAVPAPAAAKPAPAPAHGPYRPPVKGPGASLGPELERRLTEFLARYARRTAASKELTARHRAQLADPRSVAGFRMAWKEIVYPIVTERSAGSRLWDVDGNEYVDLVNGFGLNLFGHVPAFVRDAVHRQLDQGIEIGPQSPLAGEVAARLCAMVGMERAAFCNTGSEAVTAALRVARTVSGREKIAMFAGAYHGTFDEVLVRPTVVDGTPRAVPVAPGIPESMATNVVVLDYGSPQALEAIAAMGRDLAAVLVEPVQSRRPELQPRDFLHELRRITAASETALVFDEVVTGFRVHPGGAQAHFAVRADLATYGKVLGGGLPIGVVAGRKEYLDALDGGGWSYGDASFPETGVTFFAGTFVRHPLALAAARAVLEHLEREGPRLQRELGERTAAFVAALRDRADKRRAPVRVTTFASWFCFHVPPELPLGSLFYAYLRDKGVHIWEGRPGFLTTAHSEADVARVIDAFDETLAEMQEAGFLPGGEERNAPADAPPVPGARKGKDEAGRDAWFVPDPHRPGKYLRVDAEAPVRG
jgi:acyl transferase domain-containing protein/glutamate-1-semialdehyde aminotransferase